MANKRNGIIITLVFVVVSIAGGAFMALNNTPEKMLVKSLLKPKLAQEVTETGAGLNDFYRYHYSYNIAKYVASNIFGVRLVKGYDKTGGLVKGSTNDNEHYASVYIMVEFDFEYLEVISPGTFFLRYVEENKELLGKYNSASVIDGVLAKSSFEYDFWGTQLPLQYFFDVYGEDEIVLSIDELKIPMPFSKKDVDVLIYNLDESYKRAEKEEEEVKRRYGY